MKPIMLRLVSIALLALVCAAAPAYAQNARLQIDHLDRLFPEAVETVDVRVDGALLLMASKFLRSDKEDEAAVKEIVKDLKGVYVKSVEFDKEGGYAESDVEAVRQQLAAPGWDRIVGVRSKREGENVEAGDWQVDKIGGSVYLISGRATAGANVKIQGRETFAQGDGSFRLQVSTTAGQVEVSVGDEHGKRTRYRLSLDTSKAVKLQ